MRTPTRSQQTQSAIPRTRAPGAPGSPSLRAAPAALSRAVRWHRRGLAALCAFLAVLLGLSALAPAPPATSPALVAAADLPAGHTLAAKDLRTAGYPPDLLPDAAVTDTGQLVGRVLAAPIPSGGLLTDRSTVSVELTPEPGQVLVPIPVADASVLALLRVGDRITVVSPGDGGQAITLASRVRVAALPDPAAGGLGAGEEPLVVVSADRSSGARLAAAATGQALGIALG